MTTPTTVDTVKIADNYIAMWNETDPIRRAEIIARAWTEDARYVDPHFDSAGYQALSDMVAFVHEHYPGYRFRRTSGVDSHHDRVRFTWELASPEGQTAAAGLDIGEFAADGRLRAITGFIGDIPAS